MNIKNTFCFYVDSNNIREFVLGLCNLSRQVFEISLNSSLITDELSSQGGHGYSIYSEKINNVSISLDSISKNLLSEATNMMEVSLESTKFNERIEKISEGLALVENRANAVIINEAILVLQEKTLPLTNQIQHIFQSLSQRLTEFNQACKKLWLLTSNLKSEVEKEEIKSLLSIIQKNEQVLEKIDENIRRLDKSLSSLATQLRSRE
jgi:hypothetical protein